MRRKKILAALTIAGMMAFTVAACGSTDSTASIDSESNLNVSEESGVSDVVDAAVSTSGEITLEDVMNAPESPVEDFSGGDNGEGGYSISGYHGTDEIVVIPDEIDGFPVTEIEKYAFANDRTETVRAIRLSDSVVSIEDGGAFGNNEVLEIFVSGSGLETIGEDAFLNCSSLKTVVLNEGLVKIGGLAFANCSSLSEITIPSTVETMDAGCTYNVSDDFVMYGTAGSVAESYAEENGFTFVKN